VKNSSINDSSEETRLKELYRYNILDSPSEREFDNLTKLAAFICDSDYAHIHFLDHDRQWTKSRSGGWVQKDIPRSQSICNYTIQQESHMIVNDLTKDTRFKDFDYVINGSVRSYAGVILKSSMGHNLGTLCVFDSEPAKLNDKQLESLQILGSAVETQLEIRVEREILIEQHKKLQQSAIFLRNSSDLRIIVNPITHKIEEINDEAQHLLGYPSNEILGVRLTDLINESSFESSYSKWTGGETTKIFSAEINLRTKRNKQLWVQLSITEDLNKYFVTGRDITQRKRAEQRFLKQARFTEEMIQNLPGIFFLLDEQGKIKKWNNNLTTVSDRPSKQIKNKSYEQIISPNDVNKAERAISQIFEEGLTRTELNFVGKKGKSTPILLVGFRYRDKNKTYATGIGVDITEEKIALKELKEKEKALKEAQRIGKMGSWTWNPKTEEFHWTDEIFKLFSLDKESFSLSIEHFSELLPDSEGQKVTSLFERVKSGEEWVNLELRYQKTDGSDLYVFMRGEITFDSSGQPAKVSGTMQDITNRKVNEEKIKSALKEKNVLLKEIHHRVKNNLAIIHGMLQLEIFNSDDEQLKQVLSESQMRIHSMALIHETLYSSGDFANISFGNYIGKLSQLLIESYSTASKNIDLKLNAEDVKLNINQAIPCALMLNEIITNSLKHAFPGRDTGVIHITVKEESDTIYLTVADDGIGFDSDDVLKKTNTLGMTLIKSLVKQLEGNLEIENGKGAVFKISFDKKETKGPSASYFPENG